MNPKPNPTKRRFAFLCMLALTVVLAACAATLIGCSHTHKYTKTKTILPTCTENGYSVYTCTQCDDHYNDDAVPKLGHDIQHREAKNATCTEVGWLAHDYCTRCDYTTKTEIAALKHQFIWHEEKKATCLEDGYKAYNLCERCGYNTKEEVKAFGHDLIDHPRVEATCTQDGVTAYTSCSRCDHETKHEIIPALEHDIKHMDAQEPTCVLNGWEEYDYCTRGDYSTIVIIPCRGQHEYDNKLTTDDNYHWYEPICEDQPEPEKSAHIWNNNVCTVCEIASAYTHNLAYSLNFDARSYNVIGIGNAVATDVIIPATHNGLPVTGISAYAFKNGNYRTITVGENVTTIGAEAFAYCTSLTRITLSEKLTAIGESAFASCTSLQTLTLPQSLRRIGSDAFKNCTELTKIVLPDNATELGSGIFAFCKKLHSVTLPANLTDIPALTFSGCESLTALISANQSTAFANITRDGEDGENNDETEGNGEGEGDGNNTTDPDDNETNPDDGEKDPDDTDPIDPDPVDPDPIDPDPVPPVEPDVPFGVVLPAGLKTIGRLAFANCTGLKTAELGNVAKIETGAFNNCTALESITIPATVTTIESATFQGCSSLGSVELPATLTAIGTGAFGSCASLQSVVIPDGITAIENTTFQGCLLLQEVTLPESVKTIKQSAFGGCIALTTVHYGGAPSDWKKITVQTGNTPLNTVRVECEKEDPVEIEPTPLTTPAPTAQDGKIVWTADPAAKNYAVTVSLSDTVVNTATVTQPEFSITEFTTAGTYTVTVVAVPNDTGMYLNSAAGTTTFTVEAQPPIPETYTITYILDGGTNHTDNPAIIVEGTTVTLQDATKDNHTFDGWYTDSEFTENSKVTQITGNKNYTLYAKFTENTPTPVCYTITYVLDGGTNGDNPTDAEAGSTITLADASKDGYTFDGWYTSADFTGEPVTQITIDSDTIVYAKFTENTVDPPVTEPEETPED